MKPILYFFFILFPCILFAQKVYQTDSLVTEIQNEKNIHKKLYNYYQIIESFNYSGKYDNAIHYGLKASKIAVQHKEDSLLYLIYNQIGVAHDYKGEYTKALNYYFKALPQAEKHKDISNTASIMNNIGLAYYFQTDFDKALVYHNNVLEIRKKQNDNNGLSISLNNIAMVYVSLKQFQKAIDNYKFCIKTDTQLNDSLSLADDYINIGHCYTEMKEYKKAEYYHLLALKIKEKSNQDIGICLSKLNLGHVNFYLKQYNKAIIWFNQAEEIAKKLKLKNNLISIHDGLVKVYLKKKDYQNAFVNFSKVYNLEKEINAREKIQKQTATELTYKFNKEREKQKLARIKEQLENAKKQEKAKFISISVSIIGFVIFLFSILLFKKWKDAKKQQQIINEKNILVELKNKEILDSINYAKRIQKAILPSDEFIASFFEKHFIFYSPKDVVAGDFYWFEKLKDMLIFAAADCTGHGVPGAMMSVVCNNALQRSVKEFGLIRPGEILDKTKQIIFEDLTKNDETVSDGMDISMCSYDIKTKTFYWSGANNNLIIWKRTQNELIEIKADKQPIGKSIHTKAFTTHQLDLEAGDRIYLLTDGFADQFGGEEGKKYKTKNLKSLLLKTASQSIVQQCESIIGEFHNWKNKLEQVDDVCIFGIEVS
jgi:serine phosphatase RsbU (regulator of sigma subunit)